ncbi:MULTISPECIES: hypothetical protein [unclassified Corynebacterium]|uniref:hypothetical protein n=1 Tax=unclassified Corynebacterium TaxID=2624378 RepID=UPI0029C9FAB8|nr:MULTISPECIES: hypothetical protein [unclassified Corynebacterium]WPF65639.1 hypothetical protein OLX12_08680 [Corynebacterium sp. 22KM0430]WPF68134.1 hypothetical protein OLW90_08670 [Corynebacterium sp. 21KM1197]
MSHNRDEFIRWAEYRIEGVKDWITLFEFLQYFDYDPDHPTTEQIREVINAIFDTGKLKVILAEDSNPTHYLPGECDVEALVQDIAARDPLNAMMAYVVYTIE